MKFFKRKDEKEKIGYKIGYNLFGDIWENKKERSLLLLILWFLFIIFVVVFINSSPKKIENNPKYIEPNELINNLNNYSYDLTIYNNDNGSYTYYNGSINNNIDNGIRKENDIELNYQIIDGISYDQDMNQINNPYYDLSLNIFDYLNNYDEKYLDKKIMTYIYNISYNNLNIKVYLKTTYDKIIVVKYDYMNYSYTINIL